MTVISLYIWLDTYTTADSKIVNVCYDYFQKNFIKIA